MHQSDPPSHQLALGLISRFAVALRPPNPIYFCLTKVKSNEFPFTEEEFEEASDRLARDIDKEIFSFLWGVEGGWWVYRNSDPVVQRAIELLPEAEALLKN